MMNKSELAATVKKAKQGDKGSLSKLYQEYAPYVNKYLLKLGSNPTDAEDITAETFLSVMENISALKNDEGFKTWVCTIARNKYITLAKAESKHQKVDYSVFSKEHDYVDSVELAAEEMSHYSNDTILLPEDFAVNEDIKKRVAEIIDSLSDKDKETIYLHYYEGRTITQISKAMRVPEGTVKSRMAHARNVIEKKVKELKKKGIVFSVVPFSAVDMYKTLSKSKYAKLIMIDAGGVVTGGHTLAVGLASVLTAGVVGFTAIFGMGLFHNKDGDKWDIKNDSSIVVEEKKQDEDIDYSEYEMPDELKNLEWTTKNIEHDPQYTANDYYYLINDTAQSVPLLEDGIEDVRILLLDGFRYNEDKHLLQFIWTPYCSKPTDYVMLEPTIFFKISESPVYDGRIYFDGDKVIFDFDEVFSENNSISFSDIDDYCNNTIIQVYKKDSHDITKSDCYMRFETNGSHRLDVTPEGCENSSIFNSLYYNDIYYSGSNIKPSNGEIIHATTSILHNDGTIIIDERANGIPKLYLSHYDEKGNILNDPYKQNPYDKIKKIMIADNYNQEKYNLDNNSESYKLFENFIVIDGILYSQTNFIVNDNATDVEYLDEINKTLLWIPPDTHYDTLQLPNNLSGYYNYETLERLNADTIILGENSDGFVEQLRSSDSEKAVDILEKLGINYPEDENIIQ